MTLATPNPNPTPTLATQFPEWLPNDENALCHRSLSLIPMPVVSLFYQLGTQQFGTGGMLIEDWSDDQNPTLSYQTVETLAETLVLTHIFQYGKREDELLQLLLDRRSDSVLVIVLYRRSGGAVNQVQVRTDLLRLRGMVIDPTQPMTHHP